MEGESYGKGALQKSHTGSLNQLQEKKGKNKESNSES